MAIPAASRWWIATLVVVGLLLLISALALDNPNVEWDAGKPKCPFCRHEIEMYASRCAACRGDLEWTTAPESASPISHASLSVLEADRLQKTIEALGQDVAVRRVTAGTDLPEEAARAYLGSVGRGDCGWCGGTRKDLSAEDIESADVCPLCFGTGTSIACGGDRRARLGDWGAELAVQRYEAEMLDLLRSDLQAEAVRLEARRLAERFLSDHAGTVQAGRIYFWQRLAPAASESHRRPDASDLAVRVARARIDRVLQALESEE